MTFSGRSVNRDDDVADDESGEDVLSPTDGYFSDRMHPQDVYVDAPPAETTHAKELDAAGDSHGSSAQYDCGSSKALTPSSSRHSHASLPTSFPYETSPLLDGASLYDEDPPAYSAAQFGQGASRRTYHSFASPRVSASATGPAPFFAGGAPQSMGAPSVEFDPERNMYRKTTTSKSLSAQRRACIALWALFLIACVVLISALVYDEGPSDDMEGPVQKRPHTPAMPNWPAECASGDVLERSYDFDDLSSFSFDEHLETQHHHWRVDGRVALVAAPEGQSSPIRVKIATSGSSPYSLRSLDVQETKNGLSVGTPELTSDGSNSHADSSSPCLLVSAKIAVKSGVMLTALDIHTKSLEIALTKSFNATVDKTLLETLVARVSSESNHTSRETRIRTASGSVSGRYNLLDLLEVSTQSGSINVDVSPQEASKEGNPAKLQLSSRSGSIDIHKSTAISALASLPDRDYQTSIKTEVGSITVDYIHGTTTEIHARTGGIRASIQPYSADGYESSFSTSTNTGTTYVNLASPYEGKAIKRMTSSHTAESGSLQLFYPQEWQGHISGSTRTGHLSLKGRDVIVDKRDEGWVSKSVAAHKGDGELKGSLIFKALTGSTDVTVGDLADGAWQRAREQELAKDVWSRAPMYREE